MEPKEPRVVKVVYEKTVSVVGIVDDADPNLLKISTDDGKSWFTVNKKHIQSISPIPQR